MFVDPQARHKSVMAILQSAESDARHGAANIGNQRFEAKRAASAYLR